MQRTLIDNRTIRVFISSTFEDMNDERTELMKKTFPRLRVMAAERDVTLTEVDLRWGITQQDSESGKVVKICLQEIENSIPFFIGIIGNRYGWIPSAGDIEEGTYERFGQVRSYVERKLSVTDMEMQFGVLDRTDADMNAYFFIKGEDVSEIEILKRYPTETPETLKKLAELKKAVRENKKYPVFTYSDPEDLANQVLAAFTKLLDDLFPVGELSALEKERLEQRALLNKLTRGYIPVKDNIERLDIFLSDENQQFLIVIGESGLGKSALVANWVKKLSNQQVFERGTCQSADCKIVYPFISLSGNIKSLGEVFYSICAELKDHFKLEEPSDEREKGRWGMNDKNTLEMIFSRIPADKARCLIILEAVNLLEKDKVEDILWLNPPRNIKFLITTLPEDTNVSFFKLRGYPVYNLLPLGLEQRRDLVQKYLKSYYGKQLSEEEETAIISGSQCYNTRILLTILDELISFGSYEHLENRIQYLLEPSNHSIFYQRILDIYEDDYGESIVSHVLSLISLSRHGLTENAIISIAGLKPLQWSQLYCRLLSHLYVNMGHVTLSYDFSKAVQQRYLDGQPKEERKWRNEIVDYSQSLGTSDSIAEIVFQYENTVIDNQTLYEFVMSSETFKYMYLYRNKTLYRWWKGLICDHSGKYKLDDYLNLTNNDIRQDFTLYRELADFSKRLCPELSSLFINRAITCLDSLDGTKYVQALNSIAYYFSMAGDKYKAIEYKEKALRIRIALSGEKAPITLESYCSIALEFSRLGYHQKAVECLEKAVPIIHKLPPLFEIKLGDEYVLLGQYQKALCCYENSLDRLMRRLPRNERDREIFLHLNPSRMAEVKKVQQKIDKIRLLISNSNPK